MKPRELWRKLLGGERGLMLAELVVVSFLLSTVVTGVIHGVVSGTRMNYVSGQHMAALGLCLERLEQMRETPYAEITPANFPDEPSLPLTHLGGSGAIPLGCARRARMRAHTDPDYKRVTVTVTWAYLGREESEQLAGAVFRKD